jgi:cell volume regulation protein A
MSSFYDLTSNISANIIFLAIPMILLIVVISAVFLDKKSIPVILVALFAGIVFGKDGLKFWDFDDMVYANQLANLALVFVLFHGGFTTKKFNLKMVALPAIGLATWGVVLTAVFTFICLHLLLGWDRNLSLLLSVIISSTDAAAIFSILRKKPLGHKLSSTIEIESAANDPMAILLTLVMVQTLSSGEDISFLSLALKFMWKFASAPIIGYIIARSVVWLINKLTPQETGYYHIIMLSTALFTYGLTETLNASGILAVFTAGIVMGNMPFVHKRGVYNFSSSISQISNILLFVLLGVLVEPNRWFQDNLFLKGVLLFIFLSFAARPAAVFLGTIGMRLPVKEKLFMSWAGLRGAVPIVLATYPTAYGMENGMEIFNMVFFVVLLSLMFQGSSLGKIAKLLKLSTVSRPEPPYSLEFFTKNNMEAAQKLTVFTIGMPDPEGCEGPAIKTLKLPESTLLLMIARRQKVPKLFKETQKIINILNERTIKYGEEAKELVEKAQEIILQINEKRYFHKDENEEESDIWHVLPPKGDTILRGWDQVTILAKVGDQDKVIEEIKEHFGKPPIEEDVSEKPPLEKPE